MWFVLALKNGLDFIIVPSGYKYRFIRLWGRVGTCCSGLDFIICCSLFVWREDALNSCKRIRKKERKAWMWLINRQNLIPNSQLYDFSEENKRKYETVSNVLLFASIKDEYQIFLKFNLELVSLILRVQIYSVVWSQN